MNADKKYIWVQGCLVEVTEEVYDAYMKGDRKMRYFEADLKTERVVLNEQGHIEKIVPSREDSLDRLMDDNAAQFSDKLHSVEETVFRKLSIEQVHEALTNLNEKEWRLIDALFFQEVTEREYAELIGVSQPAVHKQKNRI